MGALKRYHECPCCGDITYYPMTRECTTCAMELLRIKQEMLEDLNSNPQHQAERTVTDE